MINCFATKSSSEMHHCQALKNRNEIYALAFNGTFFVSRTDFDEININILTFAPSIFQLSINAGQSSKMT